MSLRTLATPPKPLAGPDNNFNQLGDALTIEERALFESVRDYVEITAQPPINRYMVDDAFPFELPDLLNEPHFGDLG